MRKNIFALLDGGGWREKGREKEKEKEEKDGNLQHELEKIAFTNTYE